MKQVVDVPGVWTDIDEPWIQEIFEIMEPILGKKLQARGAHYFTDATALKPAFDGASAVIPGPGDMRRAMVSRTRHRHYRHLFSSQLCQSGS